MKKVEEIYQESLETINTIEILGEVAGQIKEITEALHSRDLQNWTGDQLSRAIASLAILRVNLGVELADAIAHYDMSYTYRKIRYANEWKPTKDSLNKKLKRATIQDIDSEIMEKLEEDLLEEQKKKHYSERMRILYDATETLITALQSRLSILKQERFESRSSK